jgi:hypothetical protein
VTLFRYNPKIALNFTYENENDPERRIPTPMFVPHEPIPTLSYVHFFFRAMVREPRNMAALFVENSIGFPSAVFAIRAHALPRFHA